MERESLNRNAGKERTSIRVSKNELLKDVPPVAILGLHEVSSYTIKEEPDIVRFTSGLKPEDLWSDKPDDDLAPVMPLLAKGLVHAVKDLCSTVPNVHFESFGTGARIGKPLKIILYRAVRELIGNAVKHALSSNIFVQVMTGGRSISVTVYDDGKGFDPATVTTGAGLANMAIAVIACKGTVTIHSAPGKGTEINIKIEQRI